MNLKDEFSSYLTIRGSINLVGSLASYDWVRSPESWPIEYMAYSQMLCEHAREISNSINQLRRLIHSLEAWAVLISSKSSSDDKFELIIEFIDPLATLLINLPYIIRSRLIYSAAHLSHQANQVKISGWRDDIAIDSEIYFSEADKHGAAWKSYKKLKVSLEKIAGRSYVKETHNFRNKYNHRYSPRIEIGLTGLVTRYVSGSGQVSYGFGHTEPLKLACVVSALKSQHEFCFKAFCLYQKLVEEQILAIKGA